MSCCSSSHAFHLNPVPITTVMLLTQHTVHNTIIVSTINKIVSLCCNKSTGYSQDQMYQYKNYFILCLPSEGSQLFLPFCIQHICKNPNFTCCDRFELSKKTSIIKKYEENYLSGFYPNSISVLKRHFKFKSMR